MCVPVSMCDVGGTCARRGQDVNGSHRRDVEDIDGAREARRQWTGRGWSRGRMGVARKGLGRWTVDGPRTERERHVKGQAPDVDRM